MNNNSNLSLTAFNQDGLQLIINTKTGEVFASQGAIARMCNCTSTEIRRYRGDSKSLEALPVKDSRGVIQEMKLYPERLIKECLAKFNPELLLDCVDVGLRVYLHQLAGYQVTSSAINTFQIPQSPAEMLRLAADLWEQKEKLEQANLILKEKADEANNYSSFMRMAKLNGVREREFSYQKLKKASDELGLEIKTVPCPRFDKKNLYHHDVWATVYPHLELPQGSEY